MFYGIKNKYSYFKKKLKICAEMNYKNKIQKNNYIIKIYRDNIFIGYVRSYRKRRNGKYRFEKTKNISLALEYTNSTGLADNVTMKLNSSMIDKLYYKGSYCFKVSKITDKEIRKSKLNILEKVKIREGIFKR